MMRAMRVLALVVVGLVPFTLSCLINIDDPARKAEHVDMIMNLDPNEPIVFVALHGENYHKENCTYLQLNKYGIPLGDALRFYKPCKFCNPPQ